jgi:hypothetical protein
MPLRSATSARSFATSGSVANNLPAACRVGGLSGEGEKYLQHRHAATASWLKERQHVPPTNAAAACQGRNVEQEVN